jgi:hypothetical protein
MGPVPTTLETRHIVGLPVIGEAGDEALMQKRPS